MQEIQIPVSDSSFPFVQASEFASIPPNVARNTTLRVAGHLLGGQTFFTSEVTSPLTTWLHRSLARRDLIDPTRWVADLASSVQVSADHRTYVVALKPNVFWHKHVDGGYPWMNESHEVIAQDLATFFELAQNPDAKLPILASKYRDLETVTVIDRHTIELRWAHGHFRNRAATFEAIPLPTWLLTREKNGSPIEPNEVAKRFWRHWAGRLQVGCGPYYVKKKSRITVLERTSDYVGPSPPIRTIELHASGDLNKLADEISRTEVDLVYTLRPLPADRLPRTSHNKALAPLSANAISWNIKNPLFSDPRVRRAMTLAMDRQHLLTTDRHAVLQRGPFQLPSGANSPEVSPLPFDLEQARKQLDEAGWIDSDHDGVRDKIVNGVHHRLVFELQHSSGSILFAKPNKTMSLSDIYARDLRRIGVEMTTKASPFIFVMMSMAQGKFDATVLPFSLLNDETPQTWMSNGNLGGYNNPEADLLIGQLRTTFDHAARVQLLRQLHSAVAADQPVTYLTQIRRFATWRNNVKNVKFGGAAPQMSTLSWYVEP